MNEALGEAFEEMKRADHLIYVSLKYTRTVDVIRSIVERLANAYEKAFTALLEEAKSQKRISSYSKNLGIKCKELQALYANDPYILGEIEFFLLLRKILRSEYKKVEEYRRHVTMIVQLSPRETLNIDIDRIKEYYDRTDAFMQKVAEICGGVVRPSYDDYYF